VGDGILDGVELAVLPRHAGHGCLPGRLEAGMVVANDEFHAVHAAFLEAPGELPPVMLGLAPCDATAEDTPFAIGSHANGGKHCRGNEGTAVAALFVPGSEDQVGHFTEWPVPPGG